MAKGKFFKIFIPVVFIWSFTSSFLFLSGALAQENFQPEIQIEIGGFSKEDFSDQRSYACGKGSSETCIEINWIAKYISVVYQYGIGIAAILAVVMVMVGGFIWLASAGSPDKITKAKEFIISAITGLLLALFSFIILSAINPNLVSFQPLSIGQDILPDTQGRPETNTSVSNDSKAREKISEILTICRTREELAKYSCNYMFSNTRNYREFGGNEFYFEIPAPTTVEEAARQRQRGESLAGFLEDQTGIPIQLNQFIDYAGLRFRLNANDPSNRFWEVRNRYP